MSEIKFKTLKELENKIYDAFYENNPQGDARYDLWPQVIKAKKGMNPEKELLSILKDITKR